MVSVTADLLGTLTRRGSDLLGLSALRSFRRGCWSAVDSIFLVFLFILLLDTFVQAFVVDVSWVVLFDSSVGHFLRERVTVFGVILPLGSIEVAFPSLGVFRCSNSSSIADFVGHLLGLPLLAELRDRSLGF